MQVLFYSVKSALPIVLCACYEDQITVNFHHAKALKSVTAKMLELTDVVGLNYTINKVFLIFLQE